LLPEDIESEYNSIVDDTGFVQYEAFASWFSSLRDLPTGGEVGKQARAKTVPSTTATAGVQMLRRLAKMMPTRRRSKPKHGKPNSGSAKSKSVPVEAPTTHTAAAEEEEEGGLVSRVKPAVSPESQLKTLKRAERGIQVFVHEPAPQHAVRHNHRALAWAIQCRSNFVLRLRVLWQDNGSLR